MLSVPLTLDSRSTRNVPSWLRELAESLSAVVASLCVSSLILLATGHNPLDALRALFERVIAREAGLEASLVAATPLLIVGVSLLVTTRTGIWNIGIDGQVLAGAITGASAAHLVRDLPAPLIWVTAAIAGCVGGAIWIAIPAVLKSRSGINEIVTTIMFNYLAIYLGSWLVKGPLRDTSLVAPQLPAIPIADRLPHLGSSRVHLGLFVALLLIGMSWWWLRNTRSGFEAQIVGESPRVARHAMVNVPLLVLMVMLVGGALAGLAGANDVLSTRGTVQAEWNPGYGFAGYALVFLARRRAIALLPAGLFLGMMAYGADVMPRAADIPAAFFPMLEGLMLGILALAHWRPRLPGRRPT